MSLKKIGKLKKNEHVCSWRFKKGRKKYRQTTSLLLFDPSSWWRKKGVLVIKDIPKQGFPIAINRKEAKNRITAIKRGEM